MKNGEITDSAIRASSEFGRAFMARYGRLDMKPGRGSAGAWSPQRDDGNMWLQVDLGSLHYVTAVATQGRQGSDQWVTSYNLRYSRNGEMPVGHVELNGKVNSSV